MYAPGSGLCGVWGIANMLSAFFENEAASVLGKRSRAFQRCIASSIASFLSHEVSEGKEKIEKIEKIAKRVLL